ncbi:hypothetical protein LENED_005826 [Lentinula edodes]|uniref:Uncharacterized protein n=1 Tax=Lentinula edodes TaxID=5353 RepID=A0A1Q3EA07_LENED|nr:hypothetical protein LENED_005826 [Lentinula edodes]
MARTKLEIVIPSRDPAGYTRTVWGAIIPPSAPIAQMKKEALSKMKSTDESRPKKRGPGRTEKRHCMITYSVYTYVLSL